MKVLVYFQPSSKHDNFEGARMRKTIKGALEVIGGSYTSNLYDDYDVAHFMSPDDENKLNIVLERKVPVIVSALFGEDDPATRFLINKNKDGRITVALKNKALKMLNKATLVLVPSESAKELLIANGVNRPIEIVVPGVNLARFNFSREDEKELYYRYFREDKNKKLVLAVGEYSNNMDGIHCLINAAKKKEDAVFYYIGSETLITGKAKKIIKDNEGLVHLLSEALIKNETLTKEQIEAIVATNSLDCLNGIATNNSSELTLTELKAKAKELKIKGYSKMNKEELEQAINENK